MSDFSLNPPSKLTIAEIVKYSELHPAGNDPIFKMLREVAEFVLYDMGLEEPSLETAREWLEEQEEKIRELEGDITCWEDTCSELKEERNSLGIKVKALKHDLDEQISANTTNAMIDGIKAKMYDMMMDLAASRNKVSALEYDNKKLRDEIKRWEEKFQTWKAIST